MPASLVLGQSDFTSSSSGTSSTKFNTPAEIFVDKYNRLILNDLSNNRILIWKSVPTSNSKAADIVLGQADFSGGSANRGASAAANTLSTPSSVYSDGDRLFVVDSVNRRVLIWNTFPTQNGQDADVVVGQTNMTSTNEVCSSSGMSSPYGVWVHEGRLIVSERNQRRVLIWNSVPTENGQSADIVLGQSSFTTCSATVASQTTITRPRGLMVDTQGKMFVADENANRILIWNSVPTSDNTPADVVVGQDDFTSTSGGTSASKFNVGRNQYSSGSRLFYADSGRILIWNSIPAKNGASADIVLGQSNFTTNTTDCGGSVSSNCFNSSRAFEHNGKLFVSDTGNHRILIFDNTESTPQLSLTSFDSADADRLRVSGNVYLGEAGKHSLHDVVVSINGQGDKFVDHLGAGDNVGQFTRYEWYHEFEPWATYPSKNDWSFEKGYTLKVSANSLNTENTSLFYFAPFKLGFTSENHLVFSLPKDHIQNIKDNVSHFEVMTNINGKWETVKAISTDSIDDHGAVLVNGAFFGEVKVEAISKVSGWRFSTNAIKASQSGSYINPFNSPITSYWYPLQVNAISGVTRNILSSFNPSGISGSYFSNTYKPVFTGIAFNNSTVALRVSNADKESEYRDYYSQVEGSRWMISPTIYDKSVVSISVYDQSGRFMYISPIVINVAR